MKIIVRREPVDWAVGWTFVPFEEAVDGLPDTGEHIDRIFVDHVFEHLDRDLIPSVLESWRDNPQVSVRTLLAVIGWDSPRAHLARKKGLIDDAQLERITSDGLWESNGGEIYHAARRVGWGVAHPYNPAVLKMDLWPVSTLEAWQYGALCRAIK